jgi:hypothetical protein
MKQTKVESNGFGRVLQLVTFTVSATLREPLSSFSEFELIEKASAENGARDKYCWRRWTTQPSNDELIVWELGLLINPITSDWQIEWGEV